MAPTTGKISGPVRYYLVAYNLVSFAGWLRILLALVIFIVQGKHSFRPLPAAIDNLLQYVRPVVAAVAPPAFSDVPEPFGTILRRATMIHGQIGSLVLVFQSLAVLEILHAVVGWVPANPFVVAVQVFSRVSVLWYVAEAYPAAAKSPYYALMVFAWSFSEVARYPFYVNQLLDTQSYIALWNRYTWFLVLYPLGVLGEIRVILASLPAQWPWVSADGWTPRDLFFLALLPLYIPDLFMLYTRLLAQRRKVLGSNFAGSKGREETRKRLNEYNTKISRPLAGSNKTE